MHVFDYLGIERKSIQLCVMISHECAAIFLIEEEVSLVPSTYFLALFTLEIAFQHSVKELSRKLPKKLKKLFQS